jgi:hypothetical protein
MRRREQVLTRYKQIKESAHIRRDKRISIFLNVMPMNFYFVIVFFLYKLDQIKD